MKALSHIIKAGLASLFLSLPVFPREYDSYDPIIPGSILSKSQQELLVDAYDTSLENYEEGKIKFERFQDRLKYPYNSNEKRKREKTASELSQLVLHRAKKKFRRDNIDAVDVYIYSMELINKDSRFRNDPVFRKSFEYARKQLGMRR